VPHDVAAGQQAVAPSLVGTGHFSGVLQRGPDSGPASAVVAPRPRLDATRRWARLSQSDIWSPHDVSKLGARDQGPADEPSSPTLGGSAAGSSEAPHTTAWVLPEGVQHRPHSIHREWPGLLVSARHGRELFSNGHVTWTPYGTWHLKKAGSLTTACGLPAVGWPIFWTLRVEKAGHDACGACLSKSRSGRNPRRRPSLLDVAVVDARQAAAPAVGSTPASGPEQGDSR
jgi:hypothetical protein